MGFFSSIGNFFKDTVGKVVDTGKDLLGGVVDAVTGDPIGTIGTVGKVVGGLMGNSSQSDANAANQAFAREQFEWQKQYALNRLQWQVDDAKKAGLHPMVAAGLSPASFSPVAAQTSPIDYDWVGEAGQSLAYASAKAKDRQQQQEAWNFTKELGEEQLNGVRLDNELKVMQILSQLALLNQTGPSAPSLKEKGTVIGGQTDSFPTFGSSPVNLYSMARMGDILLTVLNPDIADSLTESQIAHLSATLAREVEIQRNPKITLDAFRQLTANEQKAVAEGRAIFEYVPGVGGYMLTYPKWTSKDGLSAGGKIRF